MSNLDNNIKEQTNRIISTLDKLLGFVVGAVAAPIVLKALEWLLRLLQ